MDTQPNAAPPPPPPPPPARLRQTVELGLQKQVYVPGRGWTLTDARLDSDQDDEWTSRSVIWPNNNTISLVTKKAAASKGVPARADLPEVRWESIEVTLWEAASSKQRWRVLFQDSLSGSRYRFPPKLVAISPNAKFIAITVDTLLTSWRSYTHLGDEPQHSIEIIDAVSGETRIWLPGHWEKITSMIFSPDCKLLATSDVG